MQLAILIGIGAGMASAALFASAWTGTVLGVLVLFFLSPMPVAIAGLGWGWGAGTVAAAAGALVVGLTGGPRSGLVYLIALGAPAAAFSYLALLNRPVADPANGEAVGVEWYPIGRIVAWASLWAGLTAAAALLSTGSDIEQVRNALYQEFDKSGLWEGGAPGVPKLSPAERNAFIAVLTLVFPWAIATMWFAVAMLNMWGAGRVVARSGRLSRPWPDLPSIELPGGMPLAFGIAVLGSLASDMPGLIAAGFASALMFAFMLVGLGLIHRLSRGYSIRPLLLGFVYAGLMFLSPLSSMIVAFLGLAEPFLRGRSNPPPGPAT